MPRKRSHLTKPAQKLRKNDDGLQPGHAFFDGVGRRAYTLELEPRFVDVAIRRWQAFTRRDAVHAETGRNGTK
jgi:hypothetical protein